MLERTLVDHGYIYALHFGHMLYIMLTWLNAVKVPSLLNAGMFSSGNPYSFVVTSTIWDSLSMKKFESSNLEIKQRIALSLFLLRYRMVIGSKILPLIIRLWWNRQILLCILVCYMFLSFPHSWLRSTQDTGRSLSLSWRCCGLHFVVSPKPLLLSLMTVSMSTMFSAVWPCK